MAWDEMRWRVVTLNANDKIIDDRPAPHFAGAKPIYDSIEPKPNELVRLQHGARIIFSKRSEADIANEGVMSETETRFFLIDADTDSRAALYYGEGWRCIDTMPASGQIECLTVTGLVRPVEAQRSRQDIRPSDEKGPRRCRVNSVQAIAWRPAAD